MKRALRESQDSMKLESGIEMEDAIVVSSHNDTSLHLEELYYVITPNSVASLSHLP
jgi:hypothetical protein